MARTVARRSSSGVRRTRQAVALIAVVAGLLAAPGIASAEPPYDPDTGESDIEIPPVDPVDDPLPRCNGRTPVWATPPRVVVHTTEFENAGGEGLTDDLHQAVLNVNAQVGAVGATSARVTTTVLTAGPYDADSLWFDPVPTIHVGFDPDPDSNVGATRSFLSDNCEVILGATITMRAPDAMSWNFGTPGDRFHETEYWDDSGAAWFRPPYLHELLHAFGLEHRGNAYSMMNYGGKPWANRHFSSTMKPLPADVAYLRAEYPASGSRAEVAVLTTWFDSDSDTWSNGASTQWSLCTPSLGTSFGTNIFGDTAGFPCGTGGAEGGSNEVCQGDTLRTRFALANYSTELVDLTAMLWFSTDDTYDWHDIPSPTRYETEVGESSSALNNRAWVVPDLPVTPWLGQIDGARSASPVDPDLDVPENVRGALYTPILRVTGTTADGETVSDWAPLRGLLVACH